MIESGFESTATSRVGAGGVWQFMPGAARAYGLEVSYWIDGRRDPERAADAAARYLKDLYVRFGSWYLVFAAYNAGYGAGAAIDRQLQHQRLLGADQARIRPALGIQRLRAEDPRGRDRGAQPGHIRVRRRHAGSAVRL
jgi:soluble lytic murein transglycosylase-like protein